MSKNHNLHEFVEGLKKNSNPEKVNSELNKIKNILNSEQPVLRDNIELDLKVPVDNTVQKEEMKKIRSTLNKNN